MARLLELPAQDLDQHIEEEVEKNPALDAEDLADPTVEGLHVELPGRMLTTAKTPTSAEENENPDWNAYDGYREPKVALEEPEDFYGPFNYRTTQSLYESLLEQLVPFALQGWEREVVEFMIYNLTPEGLLAVPLEKLSRQYAYQVGREVPLSEWERLLVQVVQKLGPTRRGRPKPPGSPALANRSPRPAGGAPQTPSIQAGYRIWRGPGKRPVGAHSAAYGPG